MCFTLREARLSHPMFCNRRSLVAAKEKKKKRSVRGWGLFENVWERGKGGGAGQAWQLCGHISEMLPPRHTSDFEPDMHKYVQQPLPKHLEKKPMKRKEKWNCIKDGKNNKKLSIWQKRKESCVKDGHWEKQVDFKQTLLHTCGQTKKWSKRQIDWGHKNILNLARQYSNRFVKVFFI